MIFRQPETMQHKTLSQWLAHLETAHSGGLIDMGLTRVSHVRDAMRLYPACPVITVGGTNGKGSVCAFLSRILTEAGYTVGTLTSPHLLRFNERIAVNCEPVSDSEIVAAFERIEAARGSVSLTYFEFNTLAAVDIFSRRKTDVMVLEVGLGGRLDAVNIFDADCAVITSVDLDHQAFLGDTVEQVAYEKAGIFRPRRPAVCGQNPVPDSMARHAADIGAKLYALGRDFGYVRHENGWQFRQGGTLLELPNPALQGSFQFGNAACAVSAILHLQERLPVSPEAIRAGIGRAQNPARFQTIRRQPETIIDAAHNPHAARALAGSLKNLPSKRNIAVFSILADKDSSGVLEAMKPLVDEWHIAPLHLPRGMGLADLENILRAQGIVRTVPHPSIQAAYAAALSQASENDRIIVFGSFHTVAGILSEDHTPDS